MNLMFWKNKSTTGDSEGDSQEKPGDRNAPRKSSGRESRHEEASEDAETANASPTRSKRRLAVGAAVGVLILAATGMTAWKIFLTPPKQNPAAADTAVATQSTSLPDMQLIKLPQLGFVQSRKAQPDGNQTDIETLKKQNSELQAQIGKLDAGLPRLDREKPGRHQINIDELTKKNNELLSQIEALKKKQQQPSASPARQAAGSGKTQPPARSDDMIIGSKNPKAATMSLKEAIEAMNAGSGDPQKKPPNNLPDTSK